MNTSTNFDEQFRGRSIFYAGRPRHMCLSAGQRIGFDEARHEAEMADLEEEEREGFDAYLRCLEDENLPASFADAWVMPTLIEDVEF